MISMSHDVVCVQTTVSSKAMAAEIKLLNACICAL